MDDICKLEVDRDELIVISECVYNTFMTGMKNIYKDCDNDFIYKKYCALITIQYKVWQFL